MANGYKNVRKNSKKFNSHNFLWPLVNGCKSVRFIDNITFLWPLVNGYKFWINVTKYWSFQLLNRNDNDIIWEFWNWINYLFVTQGTIVFPHSRLSSRSKKEFPYSWLCHSWGNSFSHLFWLFLPYSKWQKKFFFVACLYNKSMFPS